MGEAGMRRFLAFGVLLATLAGCAADAPPPQPAPGPTAPPPAPPPPPREPDLCGAGEAQRFVGRPRSEIPVPLRPERQRVVCTTCPMTMDFRADRLNFFFDAASGIVKEVKCG